MDNYDRQVALLEGMYEDGDIDYDEFCHEMRMLRDEAGDLLT